MQNPKKSMIKFSGKSEKGLAFQNYFRGTGNIYMAYLFEN